MYKKIKLGLYRLIGMESLLPVVFFIAIILTIAINSGGFVNTYTDTLVNIFVIVAVVSTLFAFFMYSREFKKITSKSK